MNKLMMIGSCAVAGMLVSGCASLFGPSRCAELTDAENDNPKTLLWYSNVKMFAYSNDPELQENVLVGEAKRDNWFNAQHDYITLTIKDLKAKVQKKVFEEMYEASAKELNRDVESKEIAVRGEAYIGALTLAVSQEMNEFTAATNRLVGFVRNDVFPLSQLKDDESREKFFADASRSQWMQKVDFVAKKITASVAQGNDEKGSKEACAKLLSELGVTPLTKEERAAKKDAKKRIAAAYAILYPRFTKTTAFYAARAAELAAKKLSKKISPEEEQELKNLPKQSAKDIAAARLADEAELAAEEANFTEEQKQNLKRAKKLQAKKENAAAMIDSWL